MSTEQLQEAYRLIREGNKPEAVRILVPIVRADQSNADAWWLLANALEDENQKRRALERVLKLRPNDEPARRMLAAMTPASRPQPAQTSRSQPPPLKDADEFAISDDVDPFEPTPTASSGRARRSRGRSPLTIILALIGVLTVLSCVVCLVIVLITGTAGISIFSKVVQTLTFEPNFGTLASLATPGAIETLGAALNPGTQPAPTPALLPGDLQKRGSIAVGQTQHGTVDAFQDDGWTFSATASQHVIIEVDASDQALDPHLYLYDPSGKLIAENDDIDGSNNRNSRVDLTLPTAGVYTIRISKIGTGAYDLSLKSG